MKKKLNILYIGDLTEGGTCLQRMRALKDLGHNVLGINTRPDIVKRKEKNILYRIYLKLFRIGINSFGPIDFANANSMIIERVTELLPKNWTGE